MSVTVGDEICLAVTAILLFSSCLFAAAGLFMLLMSEKRGKVGKIKAVWTENGRPSESKIDKLRTLYPEGTRIALENIRKTDPDHPVHFGDTGTVEWVDDYGNIYVIWDRDCIRAKLISDQDMFHKIEEKG